MADNMNCSKCGGESTEGFVFDRGDYNVRMQQTWVEGAPESSTWSGLKTSDRAIFNVRAMRCADCGFLEFYADQPTKLAGSIISQLFGS